MDMVYLRKHGLYAPSGFKQRITLFDYYLIGELMEDATFCCLFHEITLST
jgi:hypothetical protein